MKRIIFLVSLIFLATACNHQAAKITSPPSPTYNYSHVLQVGPQTLMVEVATSTPAMEQGLSDRTSMGQDQGMLFDFGSGSWLYPSFWMKDMDFNLDFIWIEQNKIVGITSDVPAPTTADESLPYYYPPSPVDEVLEVNAGWAQKNHIMLGDAVNLLRK